MASKSFNILKEIWKYISYKIKFSLLAVSVLSVITAALETFVIVSFVPFITAITASETSTNSQINTFLSFTR